MVSKYLMDFFADEREYIIQGLEEPEMRDKILRTKVMCTEAPDTIV